MKPDLALRFALVMVILYALSIGLQRVAHAEPSQEQIALAMPNWERLADAIYKAENSTAHPYGIMVKYKHTTPRQACINTCKHKWRDWVEQGSRGDYLEYLASKYAPIGVANDKAYNLNRHWLSNVSRLYQSGSTKESNGGLATNA